MLEKFVNITASWFSVMFSPLLMPTYAMIMSLWGTPLVYAPGTTRIVVTLLTLIATGVVPVVAIYVLRRFGVVKDVSLNERTDRPFVYAASVISYICITFYLSQIHAPMWLVSFMFGATVACLVTMIINFKWKISGHATAAGGLAAYAFFICYFNLSLHNNDWFLVAAVLVAGVAMTSRLVLRRHSLGQIAAGFFNGALCVTIMELLFI